MVERSSSQPDRTESDIVNPIKLAEGKTKIIWATLDPSLVRIESKDDITAGDGERRDLLTGKAELATETTVNVFTLLNANDIPTHFELQDSETTFIAKKATMIPIECVARRIATGSSLARNPQLTEGERFDRVPVEFYLKDDSRHDPMIQLNRNTGHVLLFNPRDAIGGRQPIGQMTLDDFGITEEELKSMENLTRKVFEIVETGWGKQDLSLVDMKIEFGKDEKGNLIVADVIDNDSWRIWPGGDKSRMLDKQRFRNGEDLASILENYQQVAEMTRAFVD